MAIETWRAQFDCLVHRQGECTGVQGINDLKTWLGAGFRETECVYQ